MKQIQHNSGKKIVIATKMSGYPGYPSAPPSEGGGSYPTYPGTNDAPPPYPGVGGSPYPPAAPAPYPPGTYIFQVNNTKTGVHKHRQHLMYLDT